MKNNVMYMVTVGFLAASILSSPISEVLAETQEDSINTYEDNNGNDISSKLNGLSSSNGNINFDTSDFGLNSTIQQNTELNIATIDKDKQVVNTELGYTSYPNIVVEKDIPVIWNMNASDESVNSCISFVNIPSIGVKGRIKEGDNIVQFTPTETGTYKYYCSMGMYYGTITVVDNIDYINETEIQETITDVVPATTGGCCGSIF